MKRIFRILSNNKQVDLISYVRDYLKLYPETEILIGTDSQNRKENSIYAIVIGLYRPGKGAHVLYTRFNTPRVSIKENSTRLLNEVWFSVEIAEVLKNELKIKAKWIDIDLNADIKFKSNLALSNALGLVIGMGYKVRYKNSPNGNNSPLITYMCDKLVK